MPGGPLLARAREVWAGLAGAPVAFPAGSTVKVVASTRSLLCPPQWVGIVVLGGAGIATVPANSLVDVVQQALDGLPADCATDAGRLRAELPVADVRGPATLAYLDGSEFHPVPASVAVEELSSDHRDLAVLLASVEPEDAEECGLAEITSRAFMIRDGHTIAAAAGYRRWPGSVAHLCVLTAPEQRGRGLAQAVASAAVADALSNELLPQWRARPDASRRLAQVLGFRQLGAQLSVRLGS